MTKDGDQHFTVFVPLFSLQLLHLLDAYETGERAGAVDLMHLQPLRKAKVLVVDDNWLNLEIVESLLEPYQMEVDCVLSGKEAFQAVQTKDYDMVIMDHMMPDMDGVETLKKIRSLPEEKYKKLPIVVLTANAVDGAREMFLEKGFDEFLTKPIDMKAVDAVLGRWLKTMR